MSKTAGNGEISAGRRSGGGALVDCLLAHGVDTIFCVPGESYLTVLDALYEVQDRIRIIVGRHEASVSQMAEAYGKLTGKPGICFVTMGPEPLGPDLTAAYLKAALAGRRQAIKLLLLDQRIVAGLGNIYVCEALWRARISPKRAGGRVSLAALERLVTAIREVLEQSIRDGGSSLGSTLTAAAIFCWSRSARSAASRQTISLLGSTPTRNRQYRVFFFEPCRTRPMRGTHVRSRSSRMATQSPG